MARHTTRKPKRSRLSTKDFMRFARPTAKESRHSVVRHKVERLTSRTSSTRELRRNAQEQTSEHVVVHKDYRYVFPLIYSCCVHCCTRSGPSRASNPPVVPRTPSGGDSSTPNPSLTATGQEADRSVCIPVNPPHVHVDADASRIDSDHCAAGQHHATPSHPAQSNSRTGSMPPPQSDKYLKSPKSSRLLRFAHSLHLMKT